MFLSKEKLVHSFCAYKYTLLIAITWNILIVNQYLGSALDHTTSAALLHTSCQVYTNYQTMKYLSSSNRQCVVHSHTDCYNMPYLHDEQKKGHIQDKYQFSSCCSNYTIQQTVVVIVCVIAISIGLRVEPLGDRERSEKCRHHSEMEQAPKVQEVSHSSFKWSGQFLGPSTKQKFESFEWLQVPNITAGIQHLRFIT